MRNATVRQLQIFSMAATHLSFARAAEKLHLTHAAVSLQIKQLEEVAGMELFERIGKRVFLTEAGEIMLRLARQTLQSFKETDESLSALKGLKGGRIAVAVVSTAEYFVPGLLAEFHRAQPDVKVRLVIDNREVVTRLIAQNEVDVAIMGRSPSGMDTEAVAFAPHPLVIIAAKDHPMALFDRVPVDALAAEYLIVREAGSGTRSAMEGFFADHGLVLRVGLELSSNEAIKQAVVAGLGISFISRHTLGLELKSGRLVILNVDGTPVMRRWNIVRHQSKQLTPALGAFWAFILAFAPDYLNELG